MQLRNRHWGSLAALIVSGLSIAAGLSLTAQGQETFNLEAGVAGLFGALAYRSLKKRSLGLKKTTTANVTFEYIYLAIVAVVVLLGVSSGLAYTQPTAFVLIPAWAFIAYAVLRTAQRPTR